MRNFVNSKIHGRRLQKKEVSILDKLLKIRDRVKEYLIRAKIVFMKVNGKVMKEKG